MNEDNNDKFDLHALINAAEAMHDMFLAFTAAGFTEAQAMCLIVEMVKGNIK